ncbi:MAG: hypothetical protein GX289_01300 [Tissierellia bacterium]|jgi:ABC-type dipeptide/oligopeptide/nickel transport system permease subunit|nr:hypothetical protein [Tissierellia bacterium]
MKNKIAFLLLVLLIVFSIYPAMADVYNPDDDEEEVRDPYEADTSLRALIDESAEKATAENLKGYIDRKSTKIIDLLQYGSQPVLIIAFIIAAFLTVIGAFGDGSLVGKGIVGMVVCGVVYSLIVFAPQAMGFISGFFAP